jgi:hypothetical protein
MDTKSWVVAVLYGVVVGVLLALFRREERVLLAAMIAMTLIGIVTWVAAPLSIAGPSLAVGGAASFLAAVVTRSRLSPKP